MRKIPVFLLGLVLGVLVCCPAVQAQERFLPQPDPPSLTEFRFFFLHLANLDAAADRADAEGTPADTDSWRSFEQNMAGLTDTEGAILKDVAWRCNQALEESVEGAQPMEIVSEAVDELRTLLAPEAFESLARRVHDLLGPAVVKAPVTGLQEELATADLSEEDPEEIDLVGQGPAIDILTLTYKMPDGFFVAECATSPNDFITYQEYAAGVTYFCSLNGTGIPVPIPLACGASSRGTTCINSFPPAPAGHLRWTSALHGVRMIYADNCLGTGGPGLQDPLRFCRSALPDFRNTANVPPLGGSACWPSFPPPYTDACPIATSSATPAIYLDVIPRQATVYSGGQLQLRPIFDMVATWSVIGGPGTIEDNGTYAIYRAPATIASQETATIRACDAFAPADCVTATVTLSPLRVEVAPAAIEVVPQGWTTLTATITADAPGHSVEWSLSPAVGELSIASGFMTTYTAPKVDDLPSTTEVTVKACLTPQPASGPVCGTAKVSVPKLQFYVTGPKTKLALNETMQVTAFVQGASVPRSVKWKDPDTGNLLEINPADPFIRLYEAPGSPWTRNGVDITACLVDSPEFCASHHVDLPVPFEIVSMTPDGGKWQAGTMTSFTITGHGFTPNTQVGLGDLEVTLSSITETTIRGQVRILVATTSMPRHFKVVYSETDETELTLGPIPVEPATVSVLPPAAELRAGQTLPLTSACLTSTALPCTSLEVPSWTASAGTITPTALVATYTAPATVASGTTASISACWHYGEESRCAPAVVTVLPPAGVAVTPKTASLQPGQTQQFSAQVSNSANAAVNWSIDPPAVGNISQSGLYTAPATFGGSATVTVTATSQADTSKKDTATVTLVPSPLTVTSTPSPAWVYHGTAINWTATIDGGSGTGRQFAIVRRVSGTTAWSSPAWQTSNVLNWTPGPAEVAVWEISIWARDSLTPANTHGASHNPGPVKVMAPLTVTCSVSPNYAAPGATITWTATVSGGDAATLQYAFFKRKAGATAWIPDVAAPVWQSQNRSTWITVLADVGTWEGVIWVKDAYTPPNGNVHGFAAYCNPGPVTVANSPTLVTTPSPAASYYGQAIAWTATATGGVPGTIQYAWGRHRVGTADWIPAAPAWQTGNVITWTPTSADVGTWDIAMLVKDAATPPTQNGSGYAAYYNPGQVNVVAPPALTVTGSPASATHGTTLTWTATASGGSTVNRQYAFFRRRAGTTPWTPDVTNPTWQASNVMSWTPGATDVGTWEIYVWMKDSATPPAMSTYGYAAGYNPGPVQIVEPLSVTSTASPATADHGTTINWTATATGGVPATTQFAVVRRVSGTTAWSSPAWQPSGNLSWIPAAAEVATWEIAVWVRDGNTPPTMNGGGYAGSYNPGSVRVLDPLTVTGTGSPAKAYHSNPLSWTATINGGTGTGRQYALFRRRVGASSWIPAVTSPAWQSGKTLSWTPGSADAGTWEIVIWAKDSATAANANGYGYGAYYNAGLVQVYAHPTLSGTGSPALVTYNTPITWTASASGGTGSARQYALFRRKAGASSWIPDVSSPAWQSSSSLSWTPGSADVATWEIVIWLKDADTPPTMNGYGYVAYFNAGPVQVTTPLTVTGTGSPSAAYHGNQITWTANGSGGTGVGRQYAHFRRKAGTSSWTPDVTAPAWQTSNQMTWTPSSSDVGTWEIVIWFKDANTAPNANGYGYGAYYNAGTVQVYAHPTVSGTGSPASSPYGTTLTWTATASGGTGSPRQYALFRRKAGTTTWIPSLSSPAWQSSNVMSWTPSSSDVGTWEIFVWMKDTHTPPTMNTYGFAAYYNAGPVQVTVP